MKTARIAVFAIGVSLIAAATDKVTSNQLSGFAVSSFSGAVGSVVQLALPAPVDPVAEPQKAGSVASPEFKVDRTPALHERPAFPPLPAAQTTDSRSLESVVIPELSPFSSGLASSSRSSNDRAVASGIGARRSSSAGVGGSSVGPAGGSGGSLSTTADETTTATETPSNSASLMEIVMADLTGDSAPTVSSLGRADRNRSSLASSPSSPKALNESTDSKGSTGSGTSTASTGASYTEASNTTLSSAPFLETDAPRHVDFSELTHNEIAPAPSGTIADVMHGVLPLPAEVIAAAFTPPGSADEPVSPPTSMPNIELPSEAPMIVNPEPATLLLFGTGLVLATRRARRSTSNKPR